MTALVKKLQCHACQFESGKKKAAQAAFFKGCEFTKRGKNREDTLKVQYLGHKSRN
jgi:hypothetical protein